MPEVVACTKPECLAGAGMAVKCGCDILMGTLLFDSVNALCKAHGLKYMPFVGQTAGRTCTPEGSVEGLVGEARRCLAKGPWGIDLPGYRYRAKLRERSAGRPRGIRPFVEACRMRAGRDRRRWDRYAAVSQPSDCPCASCGGNCGITALLFAAMCKFCTVSFKFCITAFRRCRNLYNGQ